MKKFFCTVLFIMATVAAVYPQTGSLPTAIIRELTGDVEIKAAGSSNFTAAKIGDAIARDTIISTGFRSTALIEAGSNMITVTALSRLSFAEIERSAGGEALNVNLQAGRVRVDVNPPAGTRAITTVASPSATASVRGTSFEMDTRNLNVTSGSVNWRAGGGFSTAVTAGFSSSIGNSGSIVDPVEIAVKEIAPTLPVGSGAAGETTVAVPERPGAGDVDIGITW